MDLRHLILLREVHLRVGELTLIGFVGLAIPVVVLVVIALGVSIVVLVRRIIPSRGRLHLHRRQIWSKVC